MAMGQLLGLSRPPWGEQVCRLWQQVHPTAQAIPYLAMTLISLSNSSSTLSKHLLVEHEGI